MQIGKSIFFVLLFSITCISTFTQIKSDKTIDSLHSELKNAHNDTVVIKILLNLGSRYREKKDYKKAMQYANDGLLLANKRADKNKTFV